MRSVQAMPPIPKQLLSALRPSAPPKFAPFRDVALVNVPATEEFAPLRDAAARRNTHAAQPGRIHDVQLPLGESAEAVRCLARITAVCPPTMGTRAWADLETLTTHMGSGSQVRLLVEGTTGLEIAQQEAMHWLCCSWPLQVRASAKIKDTHGVSTTLYVLSATQNVGISPARYHQPREEALLNEQLRSVDPSVRARAVRTLGVLGSVGTFTSGPALRIRSWDDPAASVRAAAVTALGVLRNGSASPQPYTDAIPDLQYALKDRSSAVRIAAVQALGEVAYCTRNRKLITQLMQYYERRRNNVEKAATLHALLAIAGDNTSLPVIFSTDPLHELLVRALDDPSAIVRRQAAWELVAERYQPGYETLQRQVDDRDPQVRASAIYTLGNLRASAAAPAIVKRLRDRNPTVRVSAALVLGELPASPAGPALLRALRRESDATVQQWIAASLGKLDYTAAGDALLAMLADDRPSLLQRAATYALCRLSTKPAGFAEAMITVLASTRSDIFARTAAAEVLGQMRHPAALPALKTIVREGKPPLTVSELSTAATKALAAYGAAA
ncbi:MAG: HEAT repeat domain-containing protein [Deltaproteobacteria bacterium]|nr:HEAT repeat domain-containing protein [Deltaproteobacteria bacterium]